MKKLFKIALLTILTFGAMPLFAQQKFGRINMQELVAQMPETKEMQTNMEAYRKDLLDQLESIQVEFNNKLNEYQKSFNTFSDAVKQLKEKELQDLQNRYQEFEQVAQQDMQKKQGELLEPIVTKAQTAVKTVAKSGNYFGVFDTSAAALAYYDESAMPDLMEQVKAELAKVKVETPKAAAAKPAAPQAKKK